MHRTSRLSGEVNSRRKESRVSRSPLVLLVLALYAGGLGSSRYVDLGFNLEIRALIAPLLLLAVFTQGEQPFPSQTHPRRNLFLAFQSAWLFVLLASSLWVASPAFLWPYVVDVLWLTFFMLMAARVARSMTRAEVEFLAGFVVAIGAVFLISALATGPGSDGRYAALGGGSNVFARFMGLGFLFSVFLAFVRRSVWFFLSASAFIVGVLLSGSRGGFVGFLTLLVLLCFFLFRTPRLLPQFVIGFATICGSLWLIILKNPSLRSWFETRFVSTLFGGEVYTAGRNVLYSRGLELFLENPIFGAGLSGYALENSGMYPHNLLLETASEAGVLGAFFLLCTIAVAVVGIASHRPLSAHRFVLLVAGIYIVVVAQFSGSYFDSRFAWFFFAMGLALADSAPSAPEVGKSHGSRVPSLAFSV